MRFKLVLLAALVATVSAQTLVRDVQVFNQVRPRASYLGVAIVDVDADRMNRLKLTEERGVEVTTVEEGSPADAAGIKPGDVLLTYNGESILGSQQFVRLVRETPAARKVRLSLWRNGKEQALLVTTGAIPTPHALLRAQDLEDRVANMTLPDMRGFVMPDIPSVMMVWNNSLLGIECEPVDAQLAQYFGVKEGVLIRAVGKGSAGEKAGFKAGDVLTSVGGRSVKTPDDFRHVMRSGAKQQAVSLVRDHKQLTLSVMTSPERED